MGIVSKVGNIHENNYRKTSESQSVVKDAGKLNYFNLDLKSFNMLLGGLAVIIVAAGLLHSKHAEDQQFKDEAIERWRNQQANDSE